MGRGAGTHQDRHRRKGAQSRAMSDERQASKLDDLLYIVTGVDENGDSHIFLLMEVRAPAASLT